MSGGIVAAIWDAGGEIYAITSEPQATANSAREDWGLSFETVGDPHQEISGTCSKRGWLTLFVNEKTEFLERLAAFFALPVLVLLGLAAWIAVVTPGVRRIGEQFQNVAAEEGRA